MSSDSALKRFCWATGWIVLLLCMAIVFLTLTGLGVYTLLHAVAPKSAPSLRAVLGSIAGFGGVTGAVFGIRRLIRRQPKTEQPTGNDPAASATPTSTE